MKSSIQAAPPLCRTHRADAGAAHAAPHATPTRFVTRPQCELCGAGAHDTLRSNSFADPQVADFLRDYYEGRIADEILAAGRFEVCKCTHCGFIWQRHRLRDEWLGTLYDEWIAADASRDKKEKAGIAHFRRYAEDVAAIAPALGKPPHAVRILDFGMGWGYWCLMAKAHGYRVTGCEISAARSDFARGNGIEIVAGLDQLGRREFDFINASQVFEHVPEPLTALRKLVEMLSQEGIVSLSVPDGKGIERRLRSPAWAARKDAIHPLEHINCFTNRTLIALARRAGLEPVALKRAGFLGALRSLHARHFTTSLHFRRRR